MGRDLTAVVLLLAGCCLLAVLGGAMPALGHGDAPDEGFGNPLGSGLLSGGQDGSDRDAPIGSGADGIDGPGGTPSGLVGERDRRDPGLGLSSGDSAGQPHSFGNPSDRTRFTVEADRPAYWRTTAYGQYDGQGWQRGDPPATDGVHAAGETIRQKVQFETETTRIPAAWRPNSVDAPEEVERGPDGGLRTTEPIQPGETVTVESARTVDDPEVLRSAGTDYDPAIEDHYTQVPQSVPDRVGDRTDQITADAETPYDTAVAIRNWLREHRGYSLDGPPAEGEITDELLFEREAAHCAYFATAMTTMLREEGIPARYAVGYAPGERGDDGQYVVRDAHAHAWVEVYFPDVGWVPFDPTPPADRDRAIDDATEEGYEDVSFDPTPGEDGPTGDDDGSTPDQDGTADDDGAEDGTDGSQTDGRQTDGSQTDGRQTDGSQTDGRQTDGSQTDGTDTDGTDSEEQNSSETDENSGRNDGTTDENGGTDDGDNGTNGEGTGDDGATDQDDAGDDQTDGDESSDGENAEEEELAVTADRITLPGRPTTATVEADGEPVAGATVLVDGHPVGTTDVDGTVEYDAPWTIAATIRGEHGGAAGTTRQWILLPAGVGAVVVLAALVGVALFLRRRGVALRSLPARALSALESAVHRAVTATVAAASWLAAAAKRLGGWLEATGWSLLAVAGALGRRLRKLPTYLRDGARSLLAALRGALDRNSPHKNESATAAGSDVATKDSRSADEDDAPAPQTVRRAWETLRRRSGVRNHETRTPGEIARRAKSAGLPPEAVDRLTAVVREVAYTDRKAEDRHRRIAREVRSLLRDDE